MVKVANDDGILITASGRRVCARTVSGATAAARARSAELHACASQRHDQRGATDACTSHQSCHECAQQRQTTLRATLRLTRLDWNIALSQCKSMLMCPRWRVRVTERRQTEYTIAISVSRSTLEVNFSSKFESLEIDPQGTQALSAVCDRTRNFQNVILGLRAN